MNYLYIPELDNLAINMDNVKRIYIDSTYDCKLCYSFHNGDSSTYIIRRENLETVKYRLDMFFLNKEN